MLSTQILTTISTPGLHEERTACIELATADYCSDSVQEFHADMADRISDEIDFRTS